MLSVLRHFAAVTGAHHDDDIPCSDRAGSAALAAKKPSRAFLKNKASGRRT
jgi:hypothetical protein